MLFIEKPNVNEEVQLLPSDWRKRLEISAAKNAATHDIFGAATGDNKDYLPSGVTLSWRGGTPPYFIRLLDTVGLQVQHSGITGTSLELFQLKVAEKYQWSIHDSAGEMAQSSCYTAQTPRLFLFPHPNQGPVNFRDMGGYPTCFGKRIKQGILFRGADINTWSPSTPENREFLLNTLNIHTEIDLRYPEQVAQQKESSLGKRLKWLHYPINAYQYSRPEQLPIWRDVLECFAHAELFPAFFHCSGGTDRTGELAFLLNGLCGVAPEDLFLDYEFSSLAGFPRLRTIPYFQNWLNYLQQFSTQGEPFHRQIEKYFRYLGLSHEHIEAIRVNLQE